MSESHITFNVRPTWDAKPLGLEVKLDDTVVYNNDALVSGQEIQVGLPDDETDHALKIVLKNKTTDHTVIDSTGCIAQDSSIVVENIEFDGIVVGHNILQLATYSHDCNGTDSVKEYKFYGEMGCNGTVELKFTTPIYLWLLENM